ncbi:MAG: phosphotransferase, partial [Chloroflexi bacterium]|nr:phosphotransferase [Chloroflexota bacterium]
MLALDKLDSAEIGRYLAAQGVLESETAVAVKALGGGVSNIVLRVTTPTQCMVLKQALPELRVEAYWPSRIDRALREAEALRIVAEHLPSGAVPEVRFIDKENFIYGMSCAPESATLWKENLLAGRVDVSVAAAAGRLLARMHAIQEPAVRQRFIDDEVFWQLRVDPYYNTTAEKHPSVRPVVSRAVDQMKARKMVLVHGDYSPKNMFVLPEKMDSAPRHGASFRGNDGVETVVDSGSRTNDGAGKPPNGHQ